MSTLKDHIGFVCIFVILCLLKRLGFPQGSDGLVVTYDLLTCVFGSAMQPWNAICLHVLCTMPLFAQMKLVGSGGNAPCCNLCIRENTQIDHVTVDCHSEVTKGMKRRLGIAISDPGQQPPANPQRAKKPPPKPDSKPVPAPHPSIGPDAAAETAPATSAAAQAPTSAATAPSVPAAAAAAPADAPTDPSPAVTQPHSNVIHAEQPANDASALGSATASAPTLTAPTAAAVQPGAAPAASAVLATSHQNNSVKFEEASAGAASQAASPAVEDDKPASQKADPAGKKDDTDDKALQPLEESGPRAPEMLPVSKPQRRQVHFFTVLFVSHACCAEMCTVLRTCN